MKDRCKKCVYGCEFAEDAFKVYCWHHKRDMDLILDSDIKCFK